MSRTAFPFSLNELRVTVGEEDADRARQHHRQPSRRGRPGAGGAVRHRARAARAAHRLSVPRSRAARARADPPIARPRGRERRRDRQRVAGVPRRLRARLRHRRSAVPASSRSTTKGRSRSSRRRWSRRRRWRAWASRSVSATILILGRGEEKTGGRRKHALIADCYEPAVARPSAPRQLRPAPAACAPAWCRLHRR